MRDLINHWNLREKTSDFTANIRFKKVRRHGLDRRNLLVVRFHSTHPISHKWDSTVPISSPISEIPLYPSHLSPHRPSTHDNYVIDDLGSDDDTDDEDNPRKKIPQWAEKQQLRAALVKQSYKPPNLAELFGIIDAPGKRSLRAFFGGLGCQLS